MPPFFAAVKSGELEQVETLLDSDPPLVRSIDQSGRSPLTTATYYGRRAVADLLIARGAPVDLFDASALGKVEYVKSLLDREPSSIGAHSSDGWTALSLAAHFGQLEAAAELLNRGADPTAHSANALDNTPLHAAVAGDRPGMVALLLAAGASPDARDANGYTALNIAAYAGSLAMVELLLAGDADASIPNTQGKTPLAVAESQGHTEVVNRLRQHQPR